MAVAASFSFRDSPAQQLPASAHLTMSLTDIQELRRATSKIEIELDEDPEKLPRLCAAQDEVVARKTRIQAMTARLAQWGVETNGCVARPCAMGVAQ